MDDVLSFGRPECAERKDELCAASLGGLYPGASAVPFGDLPNNGQLRSGPLDVPPSRPLEESPKDILPDGGVLPIFVLGLSPLRPQQRQELSEKLADLLGAADDTAQKVPPSSRFFLAYPAARSSTRRSSSLCAQCLFHLLTAGDIAEYDAPSSLHAVFIHQRAPRHI